MNTCKSRRLNCLAVFCILLLAGCVAGRREAIALSDATIAGSQIHENADKIIYDGLADSLQEQFKFLFRAKRAEVEELRQRFLAKGFEKVDAIFVANVKSLDEKLTKAEDADFGAAHKRLLEAAEAYKADRTDSKAKALNEAIETFRQETIEFSEFRSQDIAEDIAARNTALQQWQRTVEAACRDALAEIEKVETDSAGLFDKLEVSLAKLRDHHSAILKGQRQIADYLKQKTAVRLVLEGFLHGATGLDVSLSSVDSWVNRTTSMIESRLNEKVQSLTKRLEKEAPH